MSVQVGDKVISARYPGQGYLWRVEAIHRRHPNNRYDRHGYATLRRLAKLHPCINTAEQKIEENQIREGVRVIWRLDDVAPWPGHAPPLQLALC